MTEIPSHDPDDLYRPEQDVDTFTIGDWFLSTLQAINRAEKADRANGSAASGFLMEASDDLASLASKLVTRYPELGPEILTAIDENPEVDWREELRHEVGEALNPSPDSPATLPLTPPEPPLG